MYNEEIAYAKRHTKITLIMQNPVNRIRENTNEIFYWTILDRVTKRIG